jgi:hypothetical protein
MNRQRFVEYKMMNPIINDFNNGALDQGDGAGVNEHQFSISYSGVLIEAGSVSRDNPTGFATFHYDKSPSPNKGGGDSLFGILGSAGGALGAFQQGNILGGVLAGAQAFDKIKSGRGIKGIKEEIIGITKDAVKISQSNLGATSKPGIRFPNNERTKSKDAQLINTNKSYTTSSNTKPSAVEDLGTSLSNSDGSIKLTPKQIESYFNLDEVAKLKFAKFVTFRSEQNLDVENVETEWKKLTTAEQDTYKTKAVKNAVTLSESGVIAYNVDAEVYDRVIKSQVIS